MSLSGIFGFGKKKKSIRRLDQLFNSIMSDTRIYAQRQDYKGAVIASFMGFANIAEQLMNLTRPPYETAREFGDKVAAEANISKEVIDEYLTSFEIARYTDREITFEQYEEAMQRLDICFRGIREQGIVAIEPGKPSKKKGKKAKEKKGKQPVKRRKPVPQRRRPRPR
ncbi:MAG: DUF4129 domain-containing protein [Candidatus Heimdallarchaeaceae archaeon]